jgi:hypothetical protein
MGGGLMQLVAYGAQDIYLTGNPQITFFKVVYRRHTNFSMESIEQTLNGSAGFGSSVTSTISRNGDLVGRMYVEFSVGCITSTNNNVHGPNTTNALLKEIELEIGGQRIDKHYGHWMTVWNELTESNPTGSNVAMSAAGDPGANTVLYQKAQYNLATGNTATSYVWDAAIGPAFVPLQFWFCRNPGLALPLIALQYHEVKIKITFGSATDVSDGAGAATGDNLSGNVKLWADYIYLDTDERRRFAQVSHEYLIEQLQYQSESAATSMTLNFNHPVKELIWTGAPATTATVTAGAATPSTIYDATNATHYLLKLNGHDRFAERDARYFSRTQVWQHHTGYGGLSVADSIGVYSFALKPEEHQPSGTCNFSRIDNAQLKITGTAGLALNIYAVNYNVLRIMSGMGGLAYSN